MSFISPHTLHNLALYFFFRLVPVIVLWQIIPSFLVSNCEVSNKLQWEWSSVCQVIHTQMHLWKHMCDMSKSVWPSQITLNSSSDNTESPWTFQTSTTGREVNPNKLILQQEQNSKNSSLLISNELAVIFVKGYRILKKPQTNKYLFQSLLTHRFWPRRANVRFWKPQTCAAEFLILELCRESVC